MSIFEAIIQGIVQGATEFLPVSSSGHLSLAQHIMGVKVDSLLFDILLHLARSSPYVPSIISSSGGSLRRLFRSLQTYSAANSSGKKWIMTADF